MQRAHEVKQREDYRPTPTQKLEASRRRYPAMVAKDTPAIDAPPQPSCTTGTAQFRKKSMLLGNPQHFTLQGTQRMDFMRQGNGGAVHIDRRPKSALGQKRTSRRVRVMSALPPKADN